MTERVDVKAFIETADWHFRTAGAGFDAGSAMADKIRAIGLERDSAEARAEAAERLLLRLYRELNIAETAWRMDYYTNGEIHPANVRRYERDTSQGSCGPRETRAVRGDEGEGVTDKDGRPRYTELRKFRRAISWHEGLPVRLRNAVAYYEYTEDAFLEGTAGEFCMMKNVGTTGVLQLMAFQKELRARKSKPTPPPDAGEEEKE